MDARDGGLWGEIKLAQHIGLICRITMINVPAD